MAVNLTLWPELKAVVIAVKNICSVLIFLSIPVTNHQNDIITSYLTDHIEIAKGKKRKKLSKKFRLV